MYKLFSLSLVALAFASCQNSGNSKPMNPTPTTAPTTFSTSPSITVDSSKQGTITNTPAVAAPATTTTTATAGMNPEHGAPGHRCDIPVGAPLNTPAGSTAMPTPTTTQAPVMMKTETLPQPTNGNVRLNPAHGAPGHDCAIPVGQPLKS